MDDGPLAANASAVAQNSRALSSAAAQGPARIRSLDVLRGVGVLGMLAVHIQLFAFPSLARWNPTAYGDLQGLNWWVWLATSVLADGKFISIFAMLLGVTIVMQPGRAGDRAIPASRAHVRRMAALLVLGLLHAYFLWYGDMLVPLALSGAAVYLARRLSPRRLLVLGGVVFATASVLSFALTWTTAQSDPAALAAWRARWTPRPAIVNLEIAQYRGGWTEQMAHRVPAALETETVDFVTRLFWQMTGLMLIGMALFKRGVLSAARSRAFYLRMGALGFGAGALLISLGLWRSFVTKWDLLDFALVSQQLHYWGNLFVALGWTALVMLLCQRGWPLRPVATVGRMALSNYLLQTVICTTIFYGHGFGLFGRVDRAGQLAIVVGVWAFQLLASSAWLGYFTVGPVEWVTRWFVFRRRPSFLRSSALGAEV
ncbi:MAG: DUF418 domain-containing protein [Candidatus Rokuibacteriota bacterium]